MRTLFLDCGMGAAGDMLTAALLELLPEPGIFMDRLNAIGLPNVRFSCKKVKKCGIIGTHMSVKIHGEEENGHSHHSHHHHGLSDIGHVLSHLNVPETVRENALAVYREIAKAESAVHGVPVDQVHFHEVGALDAVADVAAVCLLVHELKPEKIVASPVCTGFGEVKCAHGILPVPAPATALLLRGIPTYGGTIRGELCTPTGAALLRHFVSEFAEQPVMRVEKIGCGCGNKDFPRANCVRALLGETENRAETVCELKCNLDDMTPEAIGYAMEELLAAGAPDVFTTSIGMKKNRPGVLLTCLCRPEQKDEMCRLIFRHTTTLGVRITVCERAALSRTTETVETPYGAVRVKRASGWGVVREKTEYDDLARLARERDLPLSEVIKTMK